MDLLGDAGAVPLVHDVRAPDVSVYRQQRAWRDARRAVDDVRLLARGVGRTARSIRFDAVDGGRSDCDLLDRALRIGAARRDRAGILRGAFLALLIAFPGSETGFVFLANLAFFVYVATDEERTIAHSEIAQAYASYRQGTGMFFPRVGRPSEGNAP